MKSLPSQIILAIIIVSIFLLSMTFVYIYYKFVKPKKQLKNIEKYEDLSGLLYPALSHPASCVDCENQYRASEQWRGQPSKCFSCENDMLQRGGDDAVFLATKQKCFDC